MSSNTVIIVACLVFLSTTLVHGQSHSINDCLEPGVNPTAVFDQEVNKEGSIFQTQEETLRIPNIGFSPGPITCITVTNLDSEDNGGYPKITEGGVGYEYVTLDLKSQQSKGFDFRITVYYDKGTTAAPTTAPTAAPST